MKYLMQIIGVILILAALLSMLPYVSKYSELSDYGQGFVWGKALLLVVGICLTYLGFRMNKKQHKSGHQ